MRSPPYGGHGPRKKHPATRVLTAIIALAAPRASSGFFAPRNLNFPPGADLRAARPATSPPAAGRTAPALLAGRTQTDECEDCVEDGRLGEAEARARLEALFAPEEIWKGSGIVLDLSDRTFSRSTRRAVEREKRLVGRLADDDADTVIPLLWNVWCSEKGMDAKREIKQCGAWINSGDPELLVQASQRLETLSAQFPNWAEPYNRLATIQFHQKNFEAAQDIYEKALDLKPWHLGALNGMLMCHHMAGDADGTASWARRAIPPAGKFRDRHGRIVHPRKIWVKKMVQEMELRRRCVL